ncbi:histone-fold-containing protein [Neoconidiobolus thromboides FSU 785]|nr:histone-fold-containing protein [Neoconidiobolus thromboides FSU 785]
MSEREKDTEVIDSDRLLPIANVGRIMKRALPDNAKISKESKEIIQECASEFISFITSEASDRCLQEKRKTINGEDILWSMHSLGFENYSEALKIYLAKIREAMKIERGDEEILKTNPSNNNNTNSPKPENQESDSKNEENQGSRPLLPKPRQFNV